MSVRIATRTFRILVLLTSFCLAAPATFAQTVTTTGTITTLAGTNRNSYGDGFSASTAQIFRNNGIAFDSQGNLYIADTGHELVRKISSGGTISTFASGFTAPMGIAIDSSDNVYVSDQQAHVIKKITPSGTVSTFAGTGATGFSGDGGAATAAVLFGPTNLAFDASGNLYVADTQNRRFRKITPAGIISTVAGNGSLITGSSPNTGAATSVPINTPAGIAFDGSGNMYVADFTGHVIRKVTPAGASSIYAGTAGQQGATGDGGAATSAKFMNPTGIVMDNGELYVCDQGNSRVRKVSSGGTISNFAGTGTQPSGGDGGSATSATLARCAGLAVQSGSLYISDFGNNNIRVVSGGSISTLVWGYGGDGGAASSAIIQTPTGIAFDAAGNFYFAEEESHRVRKVTPAGIISTYAGNGLAGTSGDGGQATAAPLGEPGGLVFDLNGNLLIADQGAHTIRRVTPAGVISTIAGTANTAGASGDGGSATAALLNSPLGIDVDAAGNIYIADHDNYRIRKISPAGVMSTFAGNGTAGSSGDGGAATAAALIPFSMAFDAAGNMYVSDADNGNVRKITPAGIISTVISSSSPGINVANPIGVGFDPAGNMYIGDLGNRRVIKRSQAGVVTVVAGTGATGTTGDGGNALSATFVYPADVAMSPAGDLYITDHLAHAVRRVSFVQTGGITVSDRGGTSLTSAGSGATVVAGYGSIAPTSGSTTPSGVAIFGYRQNGVLVSEAGVPASTVVSSARIFAQVGGAVNTGLAIANPSASDATISFYFTDANGNNFGAGSTTISAYNQIAKFLDQAPFNGGSSVNGTFTFTSSVPVAVIALRGLTNERGEFLITTLPVADLAAASSTSPIVFPHFAEGGGWTTQVILVNASDNTLTGNVLFRNAQGAANPLNIGGTTSDTFAYSIPPRSSVRLQTSGTASSTLSGLVRVAPTGGSAAPSGLNVFSYRVGGITVAEAGVPAATAGSAFRFYAETSGTFGNPGSIQTGLAITNNSGTAATVTVELTRLDGSSTGLTGTLSVPANGQSPVFINQISGLGSAPNPFSGVLRVSSSASISVVGLRGRYNERGDFLITTTPVVDEAASTITAARFFPQVADSGGYTTQFVIFSGQTGQASNANLDLRNSAGGAMNLSTQ